MLAVETQGIAFLRPLRVGIVRDYITTDDVSMKSSLPGEIWVDFQAGNGS